MKRIRFMKQGSWRGRRIAIAVAAVLTLLFTTSLSHPKEMSADEQHEAGHDQTSADLKPGNDSAPGSAGNEPEGESKQPAVQCGVLKLEQSSEKDIRQIPLYCITGKFFGEDVPNNIPHREFPMMKDISLPAEELTRWGAFFLNEGSSHGYLLLAPRNWEVATAETGMDGSVKIEMRDPANPRMHLTYLDVGACQGCAIGKIGSYFPNMQKWADEKGFMAEPLEFESRTELNGHLVRYTLNKENEPYRTTGMAYRQVEQNNTQFTMLELEAPDDKAEMTQAMLDFFAKHPSMFVY